MQNKKKTESNAEESEKKKPNENQSDAKMTEQKKTNERAVFL